MDLSISCEAKPWLCGCLFKQIGDDTHFVVEPSDDALDVIVIRWN